MATADFPSVHHSRAYAKANAPHPTGDGDGCQLMQWSVGDNLT
jgi:hypothetical protein